MHSLPNKLKEIGWLVPPLITTSTCQLGGIHLSYQFILFDQLKVHISKSITNNNDSTPQPSANSYHLSLHARQNLTTTSPFTPQHAPPMRPCVYVSLWELWKTSPSYRALMHVFKKDNPWHDMQQTYDGH